MMEDLKLLYNCTIGAMAVAITALGIDANVFLMFSILLVIDYVTGIGKAVRLGKAITSNRMKYGIVSKLSLVLIPIVLAIGGKALHANFNEVLLVGMNILVLSEMYSIIGNIYAIRTGVELPEYDAVSSIGKKIRDILLKIDGESK